MSKGIAIRTILTLLLGVLVVGIVVYLVYSYTMGPQLSEQECRSRVITWCTGCSVAGWADGVGTIAADSDIESCIEKHFDMNDWSGLDCNDIYSGTSTVEDFCKAFI